MRARGALKAELVALLTRAGTPRSARELQAGVSGSPAPALTSVLTVLERLRAAGTVERATGPDGELRFSLVRSGPPQAAEAMLEELLRSEDRSGALLHFAGSLDGDDAALLRKALGVAGGPTAAAPRDGARR